MAVEASDVNQIVDELLEECGFTTILHCEKGDHHWDEKLGPGATVRAIITGFVYLGEVLDKRLANLTKEEGSTRKLR